MTGVRHIEVGADEAEQRLDRWFRRRFPWVKQGRVERMCRKGEVRLDGSRVRASTRVAPGQVVRVPPIAEQPGHAAFETAPAPVEINPNELEALRDMVIWRDEHVLVLNKPPGLAVQGGTGQSRHLDAMLHALRFDRDEDPRLVHRLDKDTSGILVLARTGVAAAALAKAFRKRAVVKTYVALCAGRPRPSRGTIQSGLLKMGKASGQERVKFVPREEMERTPAADAAHTEFKVLSQMGGRAAWVALRPITGRTHQLRVHMASIGCPIVGDGKYGGRSCENLGDGWGGGLGAEISHRLHLHAFGISFPHPIRAGRVEITAALPKHMMEAAVFFDWDVQNIRLPLLEENVKIIEQ